VAADGTIRLANRAAATIFGHRVDELVGMNTDELVPTEKRPSHERHRQHYATHPTRRPMGTDLRLSAQHADGGLFPVEVSLSPVTLENEVQTIATVRDVSERQEALARTALLEDRERLARDLHDMVIQRLFAAGMSLQAVSGIIDSPVAQGRISTVIDELDETIRELRSAIFHLSHADHLRSLSSHIAQLVHDRSHHLGFTPDVHIDGDIDALPEYIGEQLTATLTEALSNVARHADATAADIEILRDDGGITLTVRDDGIGITGTPKARGGLSNMMWRAAELGGTCSVAPRTPSGTELMWHVPG
jgi:PAS domain S-box-containing protein